LQLELARLAIPMAPSGEQGGTAANFAPVIHQCVSTVKGALSSSLESKLGLDACIIKDSSRPFHGPHTGRYSSPQLKLHRANPLLFVAWSCNSMQPSSLLNLTECVVAAQRSVIQPISLC
jgi:hypothetical protein